MQAFLDASAVALRNAAAGEARRVTETVIARWDAAQGTMATDQPARQMVGDWLAPTLAAALQEPRGQLAEAFAGIEGQLRWSRRAVADPADAAFWNGHANAVILGPGGLEARDDLWVGVTAMAPGVRYTDHDHAPEEVYLPLTLGEWWNAAMDWTDPGPGGFIYNPPGIRHAMRSGTGPFLALWYLPL